VTVVVVASDGGRPSTVASDGAERIDGGDSSNGNNSDEIQEIWDSNSLLLNLWWNMLGNVLDKTPKWLSVLHLNVFYTSFILATSASRKVAKWMYATRGCQSIICEKKEKKSSYTLTTTRDIHPLYNLTWRWCDQDKWRVKNISAWHWESFLGFTYLGFYLERCPAYSIKGWKAVS